MNTKNKLSPQENKSKMTASTLTRLAGISAIVAGLSYIVVGMFHPANVIASVTTDIWSIVHIFAIAMSFFGLLGMVGLYVRQSEKSGWLGLAGFILFSLWFALVMGFTFVEIFILPRLATESPAFVNSFLAMFTGAASEIDLGILPTLWTVSGPLYIFGGLLFGIATFRAGVLSRWGAVLLALGTALAPLAAILPPEHMGKIAIPVGLGLAWLGYSLWSERRAQAVERLPEMVSPQFGQTAAK